ncbi:MAG TPA: tetratricopeptide repeat protein [Bryobacteraceae bacterium]|nr:tetratricopeptide repeat protein [Bryobacteraceae bacterium]
MLALLLTVLLFAQQDYLEQATKALDADQPAVAEPLLRKAIEANPNDYFAHFNLALALSMQVKDAEAIAEFRKTLELKPGLYEAQLNLGMVLVRSKQPAEALPLLQEAAAAKPSDPTPNFYLAQALLDSGDAAQALEHYRVVAQADPKSPRGQLGIGRSLLRMGKLSEAESYYRNAAALDLDYRDQMIELAEAYQKANQIPEAIAIYKLFPEKPGAQQRIAELERPAPQGPTEYDRVMNAAKGLRDTHQSQQAIQQFLAAAKLRPEAPEPWREIAALFVEAKAYTQGLEALDRAKALGPETPGQLYFRAISLDGLKQRKPAVDAYRQFLAVAGGRFPDQEFLSRQRVRIIEEEIRRGIK